MPDRWEFSNDSFRRGERRLLCDIQRRKICPATHVAVTAAPTVTVAAQVIPVAVPMNRGGSQSNSEEEQVLSSNSSPPPSAPSVETGGGSSDLVEENEKLRRENRKLSGELGRMKDLCSNIYVLMSKYAGSAPPLPATELDLMPARSTEAGDERPRGPEEEQCPRLFGVSIGSKRVREVEDEDPIERINADPGAEIKSEPLDPGPDPDQKDEGNDEGPWLLCCSRPNPRAVTDSSKLENL